MIIKSRRKGKYKLGNIEISKVNSENLAVLKSCDAFLKEFGWYHVRNDFEVFDQPDDFFGDDVTFEIAGKVFNLTEAGRYDVHVNYYKGTITFYGVNRNTVDVINLESVFLNIETPVELFRYLCNWYLPIREICTRLDTFGEYNDTNPLSGDLRGIFVEAARYEENSHKLIRLQRTCEGDMGELSQGGIYMENFDGCNGTHTIPANIFKNRVVQFKLFKDKIVYGTDYGEVTLEIE